MMEKSMSIPVHSISELLKVFFGIAALYSDNTK